jgi:hypothetical protein
MSMDGADIMSESVDQVIEAYWGGIDELRQALLITPARARRRRDSKHFAGWAAALGHDPITFLAFVPDLHAGLDAHGQVVGEVSPFPAESRCVWPRTSQPGSTSGGRTFAP